MRVEVDVDDILADMASSELAEYGLMEIGKQAPSASTWHAVRQAIRQQDARRLNDLLSDMAWKQAGVILPVGMPLTN